MKLLEFNKKFGTEEDCVQYLKERREQDGLVCSKCGGKKHRWDKYNRGVGSQRKAKVPVMVESEAVDEPKY